MAKLCATDDGSRCVAALLMKSGDDNAASLLRVGGSEALADGVLDELGHAGGV